MRMGFLAFLSGGVISVVRSLKGGACMAVEAPYHTHGGAGNKKSVWCRLQQQLSDEAQDELGLSQAAWYKCWPLYAKFKDVLFTFTSCLKLRVIRLL